MTVFFATDQKQLLKVLRASSSRGTAELFYSYAMKEFLISYQKQKHVSHLPHSNLPNKRVRIIQLVGAKIFHFFFFKLYRYVYLMD